MIQTHERGISDKFIESYQYKYRQIFFVFRLYKNMFSLT